MTTHRRYEPLELLEFERKMGVALPEAYKRYLLRLGGGGEVSSLEEWSQPDDPRDLPSDFLAREFPFTQAWNDLALLERARGWRAPYFDPLLYRGSMRIQNLGCEAYRLLVVSGPERGNIWCDARARDQAGIYPVVSGSGQRLTVESFLAVRSSPFGALNEVFGRSRHG